MAKKILIVDDEPDTRAYLETLYQENGYETATAPDGDVAMEKALEFKPDLISLDIIMPNETGQKFYRKLCKTDELKDTPVVFCSGVGQYKELFSRDHATMPKPFAFIDKPIDRELLIKTIKEAIGE